MTASLRMALIITRREVRDQLRDWRIIVPLVLLAMIFPGLVNLAAGQVISFLSGYGADLLDERLMPFLLMVVGFFPISISLVVALESFVGEKERRSLEPLLSSPLQDVEIYLGKLLACLLPPLIASYLGMSVYLFGMNTGSGWQPEPGLLVQILLLTTVQALVMVSAAVIISTQTTSVRAANLLASLVIVPVAFLIQGESIVIVWGQSHALWWVILGLVLVAGLLVRTGVAHFNREELLGNELDSLNPRWGWQVFWSAFIGQARSPGEWYRDLLDHTRRRLAVPVVCMVLALALGLFAGAYEARVLVIPPDLLKLNATERGFVEGLETLRFFTASGVGTVWLHNLRAIVIATLLGMVSFSVLGVLVLMVPLVLIGYLMASLGAAGYSPSLLFTAFVLPHGVLEIPAIVLAGAAIMGLGATLASPAQGRPMGEAWLRSLADWARVMVGLVIPLLLGAALLEVWLTPLVAMRLLSGL